MKKVFLMFSFIVICLTLMLILSTEVDAKTLTPVAFDKNTRYEVVKLYDEMPNTFEAVINLDQNFKASGVIFGNQSSKLDKYVEDSINFAVYGNGNPRIGYKLPSG